MMRKRGALVAVALLLTWVSLASVAAGQSSTFKLGGLSGTLGVREWFTTGYNEWSKASPPTVIPETRTPVGDKVDPLSVLRWRGIDSRVTEFNGELFWKRLGLLGTWAFGGIDEGVLIDEDFDQSGFRARSSVTRSAVNNDGLFRITADVAGRVFQWEGPLLGEKLPEAGQRGYFDVILGYQWWHEKYEAFGATGTSQITFTQKVITHKYTWQNLRLGGRTAVPLVGALRFNAHIIWFPVGYYEQEDVHHLRTTFKQNPSSFAHSDDPSGYELDSGFSWRLWKGLEAEAGYRYSRIDSGEGDDTLRFRRGQFTSTLRDSTFERYGPYIGVKYRW